MALPYWQLVISWYRCHTWRWSVSALLLLTSSYLVLMMVWNFHSLSSCFYLAEYQMSIFIPSYILSWCFHASSLPLIFMHFGLARPPKTVIRGGEECPHCLPPPWIRQWSADQLQFVTQKKQHLRNEQTWDHWPGSRRDRRSPLIRSLQSPA